MYKAIIIFSLFFSSCMVHGQNPHYRENCNLRMTGEEFQFDYEDSIQIVVCFYSGVDLDNETCSEVLLEGYSNYIPRENINVICVLSIKSEAKDLLKDFDFFDLFNSSVKLNANPNPLSKFIFSGYVYNINTEFNELFHGSSRIKSLLDSDLKEVK